MELVFKKSFYRNFVRLPSHVQSATQVILRKLISADTLGTAGVDYAPIRGQRVGCNYYRIRIGQYRMGIEYVVPNLIVVTIAVRGDIYKTFPPK